MRPSEVPALTLHGEQLEGLEFILDGSLGPVDGYRLPGEAPSTWPVAPRLCVSSALAARAVEAGAIELRDPDTTPLATLSIEHSAPAEDGDVWLAGALQRLRPAEHGPARGLRLSSERDLTGRTVALFAGEIRPADVIRAIHEAADSGLEMVVQGSSDQAASVQMVQLLEESASLVHDARVGYVPTVDVGDTRGGDASLLALAARGADAVLDLRRSVEHVDVGAVVLLSGLSGSGKSTVARALADYVRAHSARRVVLLDGDHVRAELASELGFSREDRDRNLQRQAWVAARVAEAGGLAICAPIAPFAETRARMRGKVEPDSRFLLIHVSTPLEVAEQRDRKGLYAKARAGLIKDFTGIDSPYEIPEDADLVIDASVLSVEACVGEIVRLLTEEGLMRAG